VTANIFGERFLGRREPAWHGLGTVFTDPISSSEAVSKAKLDFEIIKAPLIASIKEEKFLTGKYGIFREPTDDDPEYRYLGTASPNYGIVQNKEIGEILDPLTKLWPVETIGALGAGETMFLTLDAGMGKVHGEDVRQFFLITDTRDGGTSMKIAFTPVRVVCQNTLVSGLRQSIVSAAISHESNINHVLRLRVDLLGRMQNALQKTMSTFELLASSVIDLDGVKNVIAVAYPMPVKPRKIALLDDFDDSTGPKILGELFDEAKAAVQSWEYATGRINVFREGALLNYEKICDEHSAIAGTPWCAYNAVTEFADYRDGAPSLLESTLFGARAGEKMRAFQKSYEYAMVGK